MNLGDKVSFKFHVIKVRYAFLKSRPERKELPTPLTGIVVAKSFVSDNSGMTNDGTPKPSNPQPIWIVATSLNRKYKVFPGDIMTDNTQSTPPQTTPPAQPNPTGRPDLSDADLETRVVAEITTHLNASAEFSAWDITKALRAKDSATNLPHSSIRNIVHSYMDTLVLAGLYTSSLQLGGYYLYQPVPSIQTT